MSTNKDVSIYTYREYRTFLKATLLHRKERNSQYSLRSLAQRLKMPASHLSEILNEKKNLSIEKALAISRILKLDSRETSFLCNMVTLENCSDEDQKERLLEEMDLFTRNSNRPVVDLEHFEVISQWECIAIFELVVNYPQRCVTFLAEQIGITKREAEKALESLLAIGVIRRFENGFEKTEREIFASSERHNLSLKMYHSAMLEKTRQAIYEQSPKTRYTGTETLMIDPELLPEAHEILNETLDRLVRLFSKSANKRSLVHVNVNLFELTKQKKDAS